MAHSLPYLIFQNRKFQEFFLWPRSQLPTMAPALPDLNLRPRISISDQGRSRSLLNIPENPKADFFRCLGNSPRWSQLRNIGRPDFAPRGQMVSPAIGNEHTAMRYKRRKCDRIKAGQFCPYGPRCWYAHNRAELQRRTGTICPLFQAIGECYFLLPGSEHVCPFVHLHEHGAG